MGICNNILNSLFNSVKVSLNDKVINNLVDDYQYKSYIDLTCTYDSLTKGSVLIPLGYYKDDDGKFNSVNNNTGNTRRAGLFSHKVGTVTSWNETATTLCGRLGIDFDQDIINGVTVRLDFRLNDAQFLFQHEKNSTVEPRFEIESFYLLVPCADLEDTVYLNIEKGLKHSPMILPYTRKEVIVNSIPQNSENFLTDTLFSSSPYLPSRIIVGYVKTDAYLGSYTENPYDFKKTFTGKVNGVEKTSIIDKQVLYLNGSAIDGLDGDESILDYYNLFVNGYFADTGFTNSISLPAFVGGYYFKICDLTTAAGSGPTKLITPGIRSGHCR